MVQFGAHTSSPNDVKKNTPDFSHQIREILSAKYLSGDIDISLLKKQVHDVLGGDKQKALFLMQQDIEMFEYLSKELQTDSDILTLMVQKDPRRFLSLPVKMQQDPEIQKLVLSSIITSGDICEFITVLQKFPKNKKLNLLAQKMLAQNLGFLAQGQNALIYEIYKNEKKIYEQQFSSGLLEISHCGVSLGSRVMSHLQKIVSELEGDDPEEVKDTIFTALLEILGIKKSQLGEASGKLIDILVTSFTITQKTPQVKQDDEDTSITDSNNEDNYADSDDIDTTPCVGPYYYSSIGNSSRVLDPDGSSVVIDTKTFESMSEKSLENFMNFSKLMKKLGLIFLLEKQQSRIQIATQINFYEGDGMSPARILKFLNSVGKNIGVPEKSYKSKDGVRKVGCFETLGAARHKFKEILESRQLGDINIQGVNTGDKGIVEVYMKSVGLLTQPFGEISIAKWK